MATIETLIRQVQEYNLKADTDMIRLAYDFAENAHRGQKRLNGEEYIQHCLGTALHLTRIKMDEATIIAGLLHDVSDEAGVSIDEVKKQFGQEVAELVLGVGKLGKIKYRGIERYVENLRKMFVTIAHDIRIIIIKFADRLHNLETLDALEPSKQLRIANEVLELYAPIADRLGIGDMKGELEDLAFKYVHPETYETVVAMVKPKLQEKERYLDTIKDAVKQHLLEADVVPLLIESRVKHLYSIYRKMIKNDSLTLDGIYDLVAMRIVVQTVADCYASLGVLHQYYKPLKGKIKDYIAQPKPNNYRSLHTTVFCEDGEIVEFQIRTKEMDDESKFGIAAHWSYDESGKQSQKIAKNLDWLQEILKLNHNPGVDHQEYLHSLKLDIFQNRIFVFTPKGDVINLPEGSTPVDFAYYVHSDVGRRCSGVRVNDALTSLDTQLNSGDVVEIIIEKNRKRPSADWLDFVKTHIAKARIKAQLREEK
ncbi:MAG: RelA/SpoT family protein [bacterium]|nr:RelA/SpoT family protein [bacterium]